ncbi:hypothetical protein [Zarconia navalis]|uniref:hypothetical protein n=1 Tax=Zarconia navalis TaxID=2992134 RepID=UPI0021F8176B|nr:hypothetical protein [Zarconia navalis]
MYYSQPPYFLVLAGIFIGISSGSAIYYTLARSLSEWSKNRSSRILASLRGSQLQLPFLGSTVGACVFLASGLTIFGIPPEIAYLIALPTALLSSGLVWWQLDKLLSQLEEKGLTRELIEELTISEIPLLTSEDNEEKE